MPDTKRKKRNTKRKRGGMDRPITRSGAQEPSGSGDDDAEHNDDDHVPNEEEEHRIIARENAMRNLGNPDFVQNSNRGRSTFGEYYNHSLLRVSTDDAVIKQKNENN